MSVVIPTGVGVYKGVKSSATLFFPTDSSCNCMAPRFTSGQFQRNARYTKTQYSIAAARDCAIASAKQFGRWYAGRPPASHFSHTKLKKPSAAQVQGLQIAHSAARQISNKRFKSNQGWRRTAPSIAPKPQVTASFNQLVAQSKKMAGGSRKGRDRKNVGMYKFGSAAGSSYGKEQKFHDVPIADTVSSTLGIIDTGGQINLIAQGVTESTRVGRKAFLKSVQIQGIYQFSGTVGQGGCFYLYLILDKQCNGSAATRAMVFTDDNAAETLRELSNSSRFWVMKRWVHIIDPKVASGDITKNISFYKKLNIPIEFNSTTGALTEICCNNLFLMAGSSNTGAAVTTLVGTCRLRFTD